MLSEGVYLITRKNVSADSDMYVGKWRTIKRQVELI